MAAPLRQDAGEKTDRHRNGEKVGDPAGAQDAGDQQSQADQKRITFERAQKALADYVATAASRFAQAGVVMKMLNAIQVAPPGSVPDVLTLMPGSNPSSSRSLMLAACFMTLARVRSSPQAFSTCTRPCATV